MADLTKLVFETRSVADVVSNKRLLLMRRTTRTEVSPVTEAVTVSAAGRASTGVNFAPGFLIRNGAFFDPAASWTITLWARPHTAPPDPGAFRQYYNFGIGSGSYIYLGSNYASDDLILEVYDGTNYYDSTVASLPLGAWAIISATYDATTHLLTLYKNNAVVGTMTHDLSTFAAFVAGERVSTWGNHETAQIRLWQAALSPTEIAAESEALTAVRSANLLADTPLSSPVDLGDISGHSRDWTASGSLYVTPGPPVPRTALVVRVGDAISTNELRPAEPPGPTTRLALPAGYRFPLPLPQVPPYTDWYANRLTYGGPWPPLAFTCCFWVQNLAGYTLKGVWTVYPDPYGQIELWGNQFGGIGSIGMEVAFGTPDGEGVYLEVPITTTYQWHHIAFLRDGPTTLLSVDNRPWVAVDTPGAAGIPWGSEWFNADLYISPQNTPPIIPRVAYYRMWDVPLGLTELRREARSRQAVRTANLWRDTPLEGAPADISGAGRDWVVGVGGLVVPSYGDGPLPWVADPLLVREGSGPTLQGPGTRQAADLLSATDGGLVVRGQRDLPVAEPMAVSELAAVAVARPAVTTNRQRRWYTQNVNNAGFAPSGLRGPWTAFRDGGALLAGHVYRLASPGQLATIGTFSISAIQGHRSIAGTASTTVGCVVHVTDPLPAQMISGVFNLSHYVFDSPAQSSNRPRRFKVYVYVTVGDTNTVRGVLLDYTAPASTGNVWPYALGGVYRWWQLEAAATLMPVTLQAGDRVVVELGFASAAAWANSVQIGYYFSGSAIQNDAMPNAPGDTTSPNTAWTPGMSTIFGNSWVEFTPGIFITPHGVRVYDYVTGLDYRKALGPTSALHLAEVITTADPVGLQTGEDLYVQVVDAVTVVDRVRQPIYLKLREKPFSNIAVVENVTRRLGPPVTIQSRTADDALTVADMATVVIRVALSVRPFETVTIQTAAGEEVPITFPPYIPVVDPNLVSIGVFDTIRVREERLRQVASSVLTVTVREYVTVIPAKTPAIYGTVWDGGGTPPAPTPGVTDDYWLVGV